MRVGHPFDGFSKVNRITFADGQAKFSSYFLESSFLNESKRFGEVPPALLLADTTPPSRRKHGLGNAFGKNDNNYVKPVKFGDVEFLLSDTAIASQMKSNFGDLNY